MPLLTSPIDGSPMRQIHRYGIEIDVCPTSGGIWLDKGELEKLMALLQQEAMNEQPVYQNSAHQPDRARTKYRDNDYDDDDDYARGYKKKGKMSKIMDLFDF